MRDHYGVKQYGAKTMTKIIPVTYAGKPATLRPGNRAGTWIVRSDATEPVWIGPVLTERPLRSKTLLDVDAAKMYPEHRSIILSNPA